MEKNSSIHHDGYLGLCIITCVQNHLEEFFFTLVYKIILESTLNAFVGKIIYCKAFSNLMNSYYLLESTLNTFVGKII